MRSLPDILYNFHWIVPGQAARSAQAYARLLTPFLKARRIKTVINLRGHNPDWRWWRYERGVCERLGIVHADVMLSSKHLPSRAMLSALIAAIDAAPRPVLFKCSGGQDRTSFAAALYLLHMKGWAGEAEALAQFARWPYLHLPKPHQRWLKRFAAFAKEDAGGMPLSVFIAERYEAARFQAWLEARGERGTFRDAYADGP